jgi:uncharacterized protein YjdB
VSVDSVTGDITAVGVGNAIITATVTYGAGSTRAGTYNITVEPIPVESLQLLPDAIYLLIDDPQNNTQTLTPVIQPPNPTDDSVTWSVRNSKFPDGSDAANDAVVTVDANGLVTAVAEGTAVIRATAVDNTNGIIYGESVVDVSPIPVDATDVSLPVPFSMELGSTKVLTPEFEPIGANRNRNVEWSSNNPQIATVDQNGRVTAVSLGTATIRIEHVGGDYYAETEVTAVPISVTGLTLNKDETTIAEGRIEYLRAMVRSSQWRTISMALRQMCLYLTALCRMFLRVLEV